MPKWNILVTGGSGFVGSKLCQVLAEAGHDVRVLMRPTSSKRNLQGVEFTPVIGDILDPESLETAMQDVDVVFHVAACLSAQSPQKLMRSNVTGTANLAQAAVTFAPRLKRFVYVSSLAAAGPSQTEEPRKETDPEEPISLYGKSKFGGEQALAKLKDKLDYIVIRPPAVYGPRDRGMLSFFQIVQSGIDLQLGWFETKKRLLSFVHVDDLVNGMVALGTTEKKIASGEVFYVCNPAIYSWKEAFTLIAQALEKKTFRVYVPITLLRILAFVYTWLGRALQKEFPLTEDKYIEMTARNWICSPDKAKQTVGFEAKVPLQEGFKQTARWYRDHSLL